MGAGAREENVVGRWDGKWDGWRCTKVAGRVDIGRTGHQECPKKDGEGGGAAQRLSRAGGAQGVSCEQPHLYSKAGKRRGGLFIDHT